MTKLHPVFRDVITTQHKYKYNYMGIRNKYGYLKSLRIQIRVQFRLVQVWYIKICQEVVIIILQAKLDKCMCIIFSQYRYTLSFQTRALHLRKK